MADGRAYSDFAPLYDRFMDDFDYDAWSRFYAEIAGLRRGDAVFEAACGTGSMSVRLAGLGMNVTAGDISPEMLEAAAAKARAAGRRVAFVRMDMAEIRLHRPVRAVIAACDGVNYLTGGPEAFFASAHAALAPGGTLAFDISSQSRLEAMDGQVYYDDREEASCIWTNSYERARQTLTTELTMFVRGRDGRYARADETHLRRAYAADELEAALAEAGFKDIITYGGMEHRRADRRDGRIHFAARKEQ